ncbi:LD-carboxypeptidase [Croceibacterium aestuarii]|uniref:LD-carboxypeptidase n=1 Tax=Croceibacterium aestuarii TaxID=3064139 RepID=UPI00272E077C|nr:LD-carboxypeptidase [Croceibacterium sp. D39]
MPRIAICAPATPITREQADRVLALAAAEFPQLTLEFDPQCFAADGHFAGPDEMRLAALLDCAASGADAVWFAKGGYGSNRIVADAVERLAGREVNQQWFGYSDCGYLLAAAERYGIARAVHGPMPVDIRREGGEQAVRRALAWFAGDRSGLEGGLDGQPAAPFNLTTLAMLCGTRFLPDLTNRVVIVEEVAEHLYAIDRLFFHVTEHLRGIAGLRLGRISDVPENDRPFGSDAEHIARDWCARSGIPYLGRADIGHDAANRIVPFGLA